MKGVRTTMLVALMIAVPGVSLHAQTAPAHPATGVVKSVDPAKNSVMLAHDPVKSLKWPAMTMGFTVKDKALLDKLQPGKKIEFEFVQQGRNYVITSVK
jgi:Cu(I)/Ag(I) efflux system protein CusF